ncbi:MAG: penicillin acylase family protein [Pirellulales bacterium]
MTHSARDILRRLGDGETIESVCRWLDWTPAAFQTWWRRECECRAPREVREVRRGISDFITIERDRWGVPHIAAQRDDDAWFGFGYAMAQDRLFQLDYLRRKGAGRLAAILGPAGLANDRLVRTVGLPRIAAAEWNRLPMFTRWMLESFSAGVNAWIYKAAEQLPIEFDLLGYRPEPWTPYCSLLIENEFRWYLTGRFPVICMPELAKRVLGDGPLYRDFCLGEADDEAIVPREAYADHPPLDADPRQWPVEAAGQASSSGESTGSNNWVVSGRHTRSGKPLVASDPHIAFEAVSCWYEASIESPSIRVAGAAYAGIPAIMMGRTQRLAWGITNNICSLRDLYQEHTSPEHPGCFRYDGRWEPEHIVTEKITVRGADPETLVVRHSRNGPLVDAFLPPPADQTGPVSLKWLGAAHGGWLTSLLEINRAQSVAEFREACRPWHVPTFNLVVADVDGQIAVQCTGRIPLRATAERGYRDGSDPRQQWLGLIPFESMPAAVNPSSGWIVTANNRVAANDYPYPLFGTWSSGHRAQRIRELLEDMAARPESSRGMTLDDMRRIQYDALSLRAVECLPHAVRAASTAASPRVRKLGERLALWNGYVEPESVAATGFNVFFTHWTREVAAARFRGPTAELLARQAEGMASRLLVADPHGWFAAGERESAIERALEKTVDELTLRFGPDMNEWTWERLHLMPLRHVLSGRGDLGKLLDHGGVGVSGDMTTVCNSGCGPDWIANTGAGYRCVIDLASDRLWSVDGQSHSGHVGSPHYADQLAAWQVGEYHSAPARP